MYPSKKDIKQAIGNAKIELGLSSAEFSKLMDAPSAVIKAVREASTAV